jgi:hypothetical protein
MSIFARLSRRRRHTVNTPPSVRPAAPTPAVTSPTRENPSGTVSSPHTHGRCAVKHRTADAAARCTKG